MDDQLAITQNCILQAIERAADMDEAGRVSMLSNAYHLLLCNGHVPYPEEFPNEIDNEQ